MPEGKSRPGTSSLAKAFRRHCRRSVIAVSLVLFGLIALTATGIRASEEARLVRELGRACLAGMPVGENGDLTASFDRLSAAFPQLLAVAPLSPQGELEAVYPGRPAFLTLARRASDAPGRITSARLDTGQGYESCRAAVLPLHMHDPSSQARRAVLMFRASPSGTLWLPGVAGVAIGWAALLYGGTRWNRAWFKRHVLTPLSRLAEADPDASPLDLGEFAVLGDRLQALQDELARSRREADRVERELNQRMNEREAGFGRQLRRALDQAMIDPLTGLRNRRFLDQELERLFAAQQARGEDLTLVMLDLDHFKAHNDTFGHKSGDDVLQFVGELLQNSIRPGDHGIRYGGDEFLLLLPAANAEQGSRIAERIIRLFGQYASVLPRAHAPLSLSGGVASMCSVPCRSGAELVALTDTALYQAKAAGRNTVRLADIAA